MARLTLHVCLIFTVATIILMVPGCTKTVYTETEKNFGDEVNRLAVQFDVPPEYFKALIILECSGKVPVPSRFEKHIYQRLVNLRQGKLKNYEFLRFSDVKDISDEALRNLASSWGPFQLMGYKCKELGVDIMDIRGKDALYWGFYWINKEYGELIRQKRYAEAFRIHNTGSPNGKTTNPDYVKEGLEHIAYFMEHPSAP